MLKWVEVDLDQFLLLLVIMEVVTLECHMDKTGKSKTIKDKCLVNSLIMDRTKERWFTRVLTWQVLNK